MLEVVKAANDAAERAGVPLPLPPPQVIQSVNFDSLARSHPQCWTCTLHLRDVERPQGDGTERRAASRRKPGTDAGDVPLRGARDVQRRMHEMWFASFSYPAIARMIVEKASELAWPKAEPPNQDSVRVHFKNHMPIQMSMARMLDEEAADRQGIDPVASESLATLDGIIDKAMHAVNRYAGTDLEIATPLEMVAVARWARQEKEKIHAGRNQVRVAANASQILMELRRIIPPMYWDQVVDRYWAQREGVPSGEWEGAMALPPGPEFSEKRPEREETERDRATKRFADDMRRRKEEAGIDDAPAPSGPVIEED